MRLARLPIPLAAARHETLASYLTRLASVHAMPTRELWEPISSPRSGTSRRDVHPERLAVLTGRSPDQLAWALPELLDPPPEWAVWRHQSQPGCARCDARHQGGPVTRLLRHHRYVCTRHRYWIGPPDAGQPATALDCELDDIVRAQWRHLRLLRRYGTALTYDAVLTGFLTCGHLWADPTHTWNQPVQQWTRRAHTLIPIGAEATQFSASKLFAAVYPEAVTLAAIIAAPAWRAQAAGNAEQRQRFAREVGTTLGRPDYQPPEHGDVIAHWMKYDSHQPPSRPLMLFPKTREYGSMRPSSINGQSQQRQTRSAKWFAVNRRGGNLILHHRHLNPVLARDWAPKLDGITATIFASQTTIDLRGTQHGTAPTVRTG